MAATPTVQASRRLVLPATQPLSAAYPSSTLIEGLATGRTFVGNEHENKQQTWDARPGAAVT